jgi:type IV secretion system protein VirB1
MDSSITMEYIQQCAPGAPAGIVQAIIQTESGFNPVAIHVNKGVKLTRQPTSREEAEAWATWLIDSGHSLDAGLMQINSGNWKRFGLTAATVFDACENIRAGATLFSSGYSRALGSVGSGQLSIVAALSAYNTGDFKSGIRNGYVSRVLKNMRTSVTEEGPRITEAVFSNIGLGKTFSIETEKEPLPPESSKTDPYTVSTAVEGFDSPSATIGSPKLEQEAKPSDVNEIIGIGDR